MEAGIYWPNGTFMSRIRIRMVSVMDLTHSDLLCDVTARAKIALGVLRIIEADY